MHKKTDDDDDDDWLSQANYITKYNEWKKIISAVAALFIYY